MYAIRSYYDSVPVNTIHVTHALVSAQEKGFTVPQYMLDSALEYLKNIENYYPYWYSDNRITSYNVCYTKLLRL